MEELRGGTGPWKRLLSTPSARGSQVYWEMIPTAGQAGAQGGGAELPLPQRGGAEVGEAQVRL